MTRRGTGRRGWARAASGWLVALVALGAASALARDPRHPRAATAAPGIDTAPATAGTTPAKPGAGDRSAFERLLERARGLAVNVVVLAAVSLVGLAIVEDAWTGSYLIEPIAVPDAFAKSVEGPDAVAARIRDGVGSAWHRALSQYAVRPVVRDAEEPAVNVTGTSLPLRYFVDVLRGLVGRPVTRISGQLTLADASGAAAPDASRKVRLTLRRSDGVDGPFFGGREMPYLEAVEAAAVATLVEVDPFDGARVVGQADPDAGIATAEAALARSRRDEWPPWVQRSLRSTSDVPRGELALADILLSMGRDHFEEARAHFERANDEFRSRDPSGRDWYAAQDGLATYDLDLADVPDEQRVAEGALGHVAEAARYREAERFATAALALEPGYDSALYHLAQAPDLRSRSIFRDPGTARTCRAIGLVHQAAARYGGLTATHPTFAIAFRDQGVMLLQQLAWVARARRIGCLRYALGVDPVAAAKARLRPRVAAAFAAALARDPTLADAPLQWGIMLYEEALELPAERRLPLLAQAVARLERAFPRDGAVGKTKDAWAWFRYGETLAAASRASPPKAAAGLRTRAASAFCASLALHPEEDGARATTRRELSDLDPAAVCGPT